MKSDSGFKYFILIKLILLLNAGKLSAQLDSLLYQGYIISNAGDTLFGQIRLSDNFKNQKYITYVDRLGAEVVYHADRLGGYGIGDSVHYVSRPTPYLYSGLFAESHVFLKLTIQGPSNLYRYYSQRSVLTLKRGPGYFEVLEKPDGSWHEISLIFGWKNVADVFGEYPELADKIRSKEYRAEELPKIVEAYNEWLTAKDL